MQPLIKFTGIYFNFTVWVPGSMFVASSAPKASKVLHFFPSMYTHQPLSKGIENRNVPFCEVVMVPVKLVSV